MLRKVVISVVGFLCVVVVALGIAYRFRDSLAGLVASRALAGQQVTVSRLQGLQLGTRRLFIAELDLLLESGQPLAVKDLSVNYRFISVSNMPLLESVEIGSAQLSPPTGSASQQENNIAVDDPQASLLLSEMLQLLREFPVARISFADLRVPQSSNPLALELRGNTGELNLDVSNGMLRLNTRFTQADAAAQAALRATLVRADETLGSFELLLQPMASSYALNGVGHVAIADLKALLDALERAPLPFKSAHLDWDIAGTVANDLLGTFDSVVNGTATSAPTFIIGMQAGSALTLPAETFSGLAELSVSFSDRAELSVITGAEPVVAGVLPLQISGNWQDQPLNVDTRLTLTECGLATRARCTISSDGKASLATYSVAGVIEAVIPGAFGAADLPSTYKVSTRALTLEGLPSWTPSFDIDADLVLDDDILSFSTPLLLRDTPADAGIRLMGSYELESGAAVLQTSIPTLEFSDQGRALSAWLNGWPYAVDLLDGSLTAELDLQWQPANDAEAGGVLTGNVTAELQDIAGSYEDMFFRGLNTELLATVDTSASMPLETPPLTLSVTTFDVGLPLNNIAMNFRIDRAAERLLINSVSAEVLDGTISGTNLDFGFDRERNDLTVRFDGLRLERLLELAEYDGIEASGAVSGEIPLTVTANGIEVTAGALHADAPGGNIRYVAGAAGASGNAGLDLVNQALGNYQFDSLISDINYSAEGELVLGMKMQGHNPDMNNGQRINLNLNLTDNVPALLQSLQAARAIEDFLQQQYANPPQ